MLASKIDELSLSDYCQR